MATEEQTRNKLKRAVELYEHDKAEDALKVYEDLCQFQPNSGISWYLKGMCLYKLNRLEEALECFTKAVAYEGGRPECYYAKAMCLYRMLKFNDAIVYFNRSLQLNPRDVDAIFLVSSCYILLGNHDNADKYMKKAAAMDPFRTTDLTENFFDSFIAHSRDISITEKVRIKETLSEIRDALAKGRLPKE